MKAFRIAVHDPVGHGFPIQLSRALARRGHDVMHMHFSDFQGPKGPLSPAPDDPKSLSIRAIGLGATYPKYQFVARFFADRRYAKKCREELDSFRPDAILSNGSPAVQAQLLKHCSRKSIGFVYWVQDCYGVAAEHVFSKKLGVVGRAIGRYVRYAEQRTLAASDRVVFISNDFYQVFPSVLPSNAALIENWAPLGEMPLRPRVNPWSTKNKLADRKVLLYTGTLGLKHNPELLVQLAVRFRDRSDVVVVVVSEGLGRDYLEEQKSRLKLSNLMLFDFQPFETLPEVIASADVLVALIEKEGSVFSVPSKVLTYLCAQRPVLLSVPASNLAARIVSGSGAGIVATPDDQEGFLKAADTLINNPELSSTMAGLGRQYALSTFDIASISARFESVLYESFARRSGDGHGRRDKKNS